MLDWLMPCVLFCNTLSLSFLLFSLSLCARLYLSAWHTNQKSMAQRVGQLGSSTTTTTTINVAIKCSHWTRIKLQIVAFPLSLTVASDCPNTLKSCKQHERPTNHAMSPLNYISASLSLFNHCFSLCQAQKLHWVLVLIARQILRDKCIYE